MSKMSKAIAVLGVVAGLGVAALPLSSYAATSAVKSTKVQVEVAGGISIAFVAPTAQPEGSDAEFTFADNNNLLDLKTITLGGPIKQGALGVKVSTNNPIGYTLTASVQGDGALVNETGDEIPAGVPQASGTDSAWGIKGGDLGDTWTKVTSTGVAVKSSTTVAGGEGAQASESVDVTVGANVKSTQPEGTYKGTLIFTATVGN